MSLSNPRSMSGTAMSAKTPEESRTAAVHATPLGLLDPCHLAPESSIPYPHNTNWADMVNLHSPADDVTTIYAPLHYSMSWIQTNGQSILK